MVPCRQEDSRVVGGKSIVQARAYVKRTPSGALSEERERESARARRQRANVSRRDRDRVCVHRVSLSRVALESQVYLI